MNNILVIAAHPDDEVLGCGGTIAAHSQAGDAVHVLILAEGITSREDHRDRDKNSTKLTQLSKSAQEANRLLGAASVYLHDFPDNRMDSIDRLTVIKLIEKFVDKYKPSIVYTHHAGDLNVDHRIIHEAVVTACRPALGNSVNTLLFFEIASSTEWQTSYSAPPFTPNWFVDISSTLNIKLKALEVYNSEMRDWPHPRSLKGVEYLARWRGGSSGLDAAEAFILGRKIVVGRGMPCEQNSEYCR